VRRRSRNRLVIAFNALSVRPDSWGGGATFALNVLRHLPSALDEAEIVVFCRPGETRLPESPNLRRQELRVTGTAGRMAVELFRLPFELRRVSADVFISPNESLPVHVPCPSVVVAQNLVYHCSRVNAFDGAHARDRLASRLQRAYYRRMMTDAYSRARIVVAVSAETRRLLGERAGLDPAKTHVVWEGSDSFLLAPPSARIEPEPRLLVVSALAPYKNLERTLELFALLRREHPELVLEIVGADWRGFKTVLENAVATLELGGCVEVAGPAGPARLVDLYERSLLLLHLSDCESFGLPVVEAMRYGLLVVAARRSSLPEVSGDGALLVDPDDVAGAAKAIGRLLLDEREQSALRERGYARAAELSWSATAQGIARAALAAAGS